MEKEKFIIKDQAAEYYFMEFLPFIGSPSFGPRKDAKEYTDKSEAEKIATQLSDRFQTFTVVAG